MRDMELSPSAPIGLSPKENQHGKKIFKESIGLGQARDEEAQVRHFKEWPLGSQSEKPQAGHRDRIVGSESRRPESPEEAVRQARQKQPAEVPQVIGAGRASARTADGPAFPSGV